MKKHNESKSTMGIRHSKGKALYKVTIFTMIFVMLFCISAYADYENIVVTDYETQEPITINANIEVYSYTNQPYIYTIKDVQFENNIVHNSIKGYGTKIQAEVINETNNKTYGIYEISLNYEHNGFSITTQTLKEEEKEYVINNDIYIVKYGELTAITSEEKSDVIQTIEDENHRVINTNNYTEIIEIREKNTFERFMDNGRQLTTMLFMVIQMIFNWLVSPNVIVFFGLGIILSLTTVGILIARRFFWGR